MRQPEDAGNREGLSPSSWSPGQDPSTTRDVVGRGAGRRNKYPVASLHPPPVLHQSLPWASPLSSQVTVALGTAAFGEHPLTLPTRYSEEQGNSEVWA